MSHFLGIFRKNFVFAVSDANTFSSYVGRDDLMKKRLTFSRPFRIVLLVATLGAELMSIDVKEKSQKACKTGSKFVIGRRKEKKLA